MFNSQFSKMSCKYFQFFSKTSKNNNFSTLFYSIFSTSYLDRNLTNGQMYYYQIYAINIVGLFGPLSGVINATPVKPPSPPQSPTPTPEPTQPSLIPIALLIASIGIASILIVVAGWRRLTKKKRSI